MDDETRSVLIGIYQHLRHDHERISDLKTAVTALLAVMEKDQAFGPKYDQALDIAKRAAETKKHYQRGVDLIETVVAELSTRNPR
jgi:hypothetical protein